MGITLFPRPGSICGAATFAISPAYGTQKAIVSALEDVQTTPEAMALTPTGGAIAAAAADPRMKEIGRSQYIVLITDGKPLCPRPQP